MAARAVSRGRKGVEKVVRMTFIHGLESGPKGTKARRLEKIGGVELTSVQMPVYALSLDPRVNPLYWVGIGSGIGGVVEAWILGDPILSTLSVGLGLLGAWGSLKVALREICVRSLAEQLKHFTPAPEVIVASSFGGFIALALAHTIWRGPMVLLAPAQGSMMRRILFPWESEEGLYKTLVQSAMQRSHTSFPILPPLHSSPPPENMRVVIIHSPTDASVPFQDSVHLSSSLPCPVRFVEAEDDHRLNNVATKEAMEEWVREVRGAG